MWFNIFFLEFLFMVHIFIYLVCASHPVLGRGRGGGGGTGSVDFQNHNFHNFYKKQHESCSNSL